MITFNYPGLEPGVTVNTTGNFFDEFESLEKINSYLKNGMFEDKIKLLDEMELKVNKTYYLTSYMDDEWVYSYIICKSDDSCYKLYETSNVYRNDLNLASISNYFFRTVIYNHSNRWMLATNESVKKELLTIKKNGEITFCHKELETHIELNELNDFFDTYMPAFNLNAIKKDGKYVIEKIS